MMNVGKILSSKGVSRQSEEKLPLLGSANGMGAIKDSQYSGLPLFLKAAFGVGHVLNDICAALWFSYTLLFFQVVLGMEPVVAGVLILTGQLADALATPIVGVLSDRMGSRKLWHMTGTGLVVLSFPFILARCPVCSGPWSAPVYYAGLIIIFQTGWAIIQISHLSLIPELTSCKRERAELTAIRYTASVCASVAVYAITWTVFHVTKQTDDDRIDIEDAYKFNYIVLIGVMIGTVTSLWFYYGLRDSEYPATTRAVRLRRPDGMLAYLRSPVLFQVALLYVSSRLFLTISLVYMPLYLDESIIDAPDEALASVPLVSYVASFLASLAIKYANKSCGNKVIYLVGAVLSIAGCIWIRMDSGANFFTAEIYGAALLLGAGSSITMVTSLCITADLIGTHTESGAFVYSVVAFADKLFNGIAVIVIERLIGASWGRRTGDARVRYYWRRVTRRPVHYCTFRRNSSG